MPSVLGKLQQPIHGASVAPSNESYCNDMDLVASVKTYSVAPEINEMTTRQDFMRKAHSCANAVKAVSVLGVGMGNGWSA